MKISVQHIGDINRESLEAYKEYEACLTTTMYGDTYLDPEKCKARGFDPIKAFKEEEERIDLSLEWIKRTTKKKDFALNSKNGLTKHRLAPQEFVNKDLKFLVYFDDLDDSPKKGNKSKKLSKKKIYYLLSKASHFVDCKVKLDDGVCVKVVKVISMKMNKDSVFLEMEEKVGDELEYYEIMY
ncbi:6224_t:CDS:2 [Funneliformis caledonium]|uniref:6224_t:CDS:1 n=1 Tax=Funneliformis caledonium TaxID=1117310 RepID=A0A9N9IL03_9GLOM|nr:6224_t:CDS:2 [Funneliformis caledonium]